MTRINYRIVVATSSAFVALGGIMSAVLSLFYDNSRVFSYGVAAMIAGIAVLVVALNPASTDDD